MARSCPGTLVTVLGWSSGSNGLSPLGGQLREPRRKNRDRLCLAFAAWLEDQGVPLALFEESPVLDVDAINAVMVRYGRALYSSGRPYSHFSETINALASRQPRLRRLLQQSWDVAFQWQRLEPHVHHQAMPWQVLLAILAAALCWGWLDVAGILALAWGGMARIGEVFAAVRRDLVLPVDIGEDFLLYPFVREGTKDPEHSSEASGLARRPASACASGDFSF